ncbi:hypothetical protein [Paenibacillus chitinolyticus]
MEEKQMLRIDTIQDLNSASVQRKVFPKSAISFLCNFFNQIHQSLDQERSLFQLSDHGYELLILMPEDRLSDRQMEAWSNKVEYAEQISLGDCKLVKMCLMEDNESFTFLFTVVEVLTEDVQKWVSTLVEGGDLP